MINCLFLHTFFYKFKDIQYWIGMKPIFFPIGLLLIKGGFRKKANLSSIHLAEY